MNDWTAGYVADIDYTFGYYAELNPLRVKLPFLNHGMVSPDIKTACELGFGQGLSTNIHAAASNVEWYGTDFNPSQASFAQELAQAAGGGAKLYDEAFGDFIHRIDLPDFDYIALHGIWSWISDENRAAIVEFVRRKMKPGGVLYISYNTFPGWASFAPMRQLMAEHADVLGADGGGTIGRVDGAMDFAQKLLATNPLFLRAHPLVAERLEKMRGHNRHYLAHEYFNRDWHPMHFSSAARWLQDAKVRYACSANYFDHIDAIHLTSEQQNFLRDLPDPNFRESVRDFMVNQQFRKDYWIRGGRKLSALSQVETLRHQRFMLVSQQSAITLKVTGALGESTMTESIYRPILDVLADNMPYSLGHIETSLHGKGINFSEIIQATLLLSAAGYVDPVQEDEIISQARKKTKRLNHHLCMKARDRNDITFLASPVTGGGHMTGRFQQLFLLALEQGKKRPAEWASYAWTILAAQGQKIIKDGNALETIEENLAELTEQATQFDKNQLSIFKALQIA